jgi:hypothetical protein
MTTALATRADAIEQALVGGDLSRLAAPERVAYYNQVCASLDLNPLTKPFAYITLNGKLTLYALKDCTEQLRSKRSVSVQIVAREVVEDIYVVTARATLPSGRCDESIGAVPLGALKGEARANAVMKAETKAKRRVTLSICGLGMLDEMEIDSIPNHSYTVEPVKSEPKQIAAPERGAPDTVEKTVPSIPPAPAPPQDDSSPAGSSPEEGANGFHLGVASLYVERVDVHPTGNPNIQKADIVLSNGETHSTRNTQAISLAEQLCQDREPVELSYGPRGGFLGVKRKMHSEPAPVVDSPLTADDLAF